MSRAMMESWLRMLPDDEVLPPFCVELVMKDGRSFYVHSGGFDDEESNDLTLRVWDLRAFGPKDLDDLQRALNGIPDRGGLAHPEKIHPKLDWAVLRAHLDDVRYCVEWHDRLWPQDKRPSLGFHTRTADRGR